MALCRWRSSIKRGRGRQGGWVGVLPCRVPTLLPVFVWGTWLTRRAERLQRRAQRPAAKTQRLQINEHTDSGSCTQQKAMRLEEFTTVSQRTKKKNAFEESYNSPRAWMWICKWKKILAFVGCIELFGVFTAECVCVWRCLDILRVTPQLYSNRFYVFERKINGVILKVIRKKTT